jgi:NAD dependent epimerase/dehydratase family enzyme
LGAPLGNGKQWMSWIHVNDLCRLFMHALENANVNGAINAVAPNPVTNKELSKTLAEVMKKTFFAPAVPVFALKLFLGEMATIATMSQKVSAKKAIDTGFEFHFSDLRLALEDFYK